MYKNVLKIIRDAGYEGYLVGGSVRDMIIGRDTVDYDICTSAHPNEIKRIFSGHTVIETGIKHGTVTVIYEGTPFEITAYRSEKGYTDKRHPDKVIFGASLQEDLLRRDFTMNAVCYDGEKFIDPLNGTEDIKNRIIRAVGDPQKRFCEDALRILRGLRFAAVLGFEIEPDTSKAMYDNSCDISAVSPERIFAEFSAAAKGCYFGQVYITYYDIFARFIPNAIKEKQIFANATQATEALKALKADKKSIKKAEVYFTAPQAEPIELLRMYGKEYAYFLCEKRGSLNIMEKTLESGVPYSVSMLDISGNDIIPLTDDKTKTGKILEKLLDSVICGETENKRESLLKKAVDIL